MTDLSDSLLNTITHHTLPGLNPVEDFVFPYYDGLSILNIPSTACRILNIPELPASSVQADIYSGLSNDIQNVILILMDALAYHRLQAWLADYPDLIWNQLLSNGRLAPLTSISPSTTSAAMTSLWTSTPALQHGVMGYEMWLKEYGVVANMIEHKPAAFARSAGSLEAAGFSADSFLPVESITSHLRQHGVTPHVFQHYAILGSGLSRTFLDDAERHGINTQADLWVNVRELLETDTNSRKYVWAYWSALDGASHIYGPDHDIPLAEFRLYSAAFEQFFLNELDPQVRDRTLVILTGDHGQITTDKTDEHGYLTSHPELTGMLHMNPTGENRLAYLHIKPGQIDAVRDYIDQTWPDQYLLIDPETALTSGLFGSGTPHPGIRDRIGDLVVVARGDARLWWSDRSDPLIGRHGGLHTQEMIVPLLVMPL